MTIKFGDQAAYPHDIGRGSGGFAECEDGITIRDKAEIAFISGCLADETIGASSAVEVGMKAAKFWIEAREKEI